MPLTLLKSRYQAPPNPKTHNKKLEMQNKTALYLRNNESSTKHSYQQKDLFYVNIF